VDFLILEIIGKTSPTLDGLPIGESGNHVPSVEEILSDNEIEHTETLQSTQEQSLNEKSKPSKRKRCETESPNTTEAETERSKKASLQNTLMEIQIYKLRLECLKRERELCISVSNITRKDPDKSVPIDIDYDL